MEQDFKYFAFISYKREDEKWAKWLQNKLETYKLPSSLPVEEGKKYPKTLHPCFRDKADLGETGDLSKILRDKLADSQYLIVICSPRSAKSEWVNMEVETFQEMGRADKIIPFIIEGNPDTSNPDSHCYPSALNDNILGISIPELGKEQAAVKTIAAMLRIEFDTLWNRHRERVFKRRIKIAVISIILIALFGGFSAYQALTIAKQRDKIEEEYQRAEKLINAFYFYDGKFALAYKDDKFYFIDKKGDAVEKLGYWNQAGQFTDGFAKVANQNAIYLLDTLGNTYKYSMNINYIDSSIQVLDLSQQNLLELPAEIGKFTNLIWLSLSHNKLTSLSPEIGKLMNLTRLDLQGNRLTRLPPEIGKLTKLTKLDLHRNYLLSLPPEIGKLTQLIQLNLAYNYITSLPPEIENLKNLKKSDLAIYDSPHGEFKFARILFELGVNGDDITSLPPEIRELMDAESALNNASKEIILEETVKSKKE